MDRRDLIPSEHYKERLILLDILAGTASGFDVDAQAFLSITPSKLYPFLFARLQSAVVPDSLLDVLRAAHRRNALQQLRRSLELRRIDETLRAESISFLVLKGPVLAASVYPDVAARTMTDLDLLVAEGDLSRAMTALWNAGYSVPPRFAATEMAAEDAPPLIHDEPGGPSIELHTMLDSLPNERDALATTLPKAQAVDLGHGLVVRTLERGEFFAHVAAHVSRHHLFKGELRSLLDVALLLRRDVEDLDWKTWFDLWERRGIAEWINLTMQLAHLLLRAPMPQSLVRRPVNEEALALAVEQLWIVEPTRVGLRIAYALAGSAPAPVHTHVAPNPARMPKGLQGIRARAARLKHKAGNAVAAAARPAIVLAEAGLVKKRGRLVEIIENERRSR